MGAIEACDEYSFCYAPGMELEVSNSPKEAEGVAVFSLEQRITEICKEYTKKGRCGNAGIGGIFSLMIYRRRGY